tara:strand:- start:1121 stop:1765 length:645 start_codon:yes stop_codon:yes gene_type:complete
VSNNFWEEKLESKSEEDFEKELDEIGNEVQDIDSEVQKIQNETENTVELNEASFGGIVTLWFFTIVWCSASLFATVIIGSDMIADIGTRNWEPADGIVENSYVSTSTGGEGGTTYCLHVDYRYTVDGRTYSGDRISYSADNSCNSWSANSDEDYPEGKEITVYYDPSNPSESVILSGLSGVDFFICCFFIFPLVGLLLLFASLKSTVGLFTKRR